jgi:phage-related protein (TIGR01555 family)
MKKGGRKPAQAARQAKPYVSPKIEAAEVPTTFAFDVGDDDVGAGNVMTAPLRAIEVMKPLPGVVPEGLKAMAQDAGLYSNQFVQWSNESLAFPGFPVLAELAQRPEYRHISETIAREMTRKWIKITSSGDDDKSDIVAALEAEMDRLNVRGVFYEAALHDGLFGRGHIYVDVGGKTNTAAILPLTPASVRKGAKVSLRTVEPVWTYPGNYEANNPLDIDFYRPTNWWVMGKTVDRTRLLTLIGREMPDLLKPAYGFAGLSMSQIAIPYVQNWLRTRQSVSDMLHSFSVMVLATNMSAMQQQGGPQGMVNRAKGFNLLRDNRGLMMIDQATETLTNVSASLGGLDHLQAQAQEQMASVSGIPLVKLLGVSPAGLNASSDGEIRVFYDTIKAYQIKLFGAPLKRIMDVLQLSLFGAIDDEISFEFESLWELDETAQAANRKTDADTDVLYVNAGILAPEEVRERVARADGSAYSNIDVDDVPERPEAGLGGEEGLNEDPSEHAEPDERDGV